jgi:hypothetical protein
MRTNNLSVREFSFMLLSIFFLSALAPIHMEAQKTVKQKSVKLNLPVSGAVILLATGDNCDEVRSLTIASNGEHVLSVKGLKVCNYSVEWSRKLLESLLRKAGIAKNEPGAMQIQIETSRRGESKIQSSLNNIDIEYPFSTTYQFSGGPYNESTSNIDDGRLPGPNDPSLAPNSLRFKITFVGFTRRRER